MATRALYYRIDRGELDRFLKRPVLLKKLDPRVPLADGRAIDLGRGWEELGCLLEGGISTPTSAPSVGDIDLWSDDRRSWSYVEPDRVKVFANRLVKITRAEFYKSYHVDDDETQDRLPHEQTGKQTSRADYLFQKLGRLAAHYEAAAKTGQAMLVQISEHQPNDGPPI